jgi:peptidoglycan/LPS O-acetylase OafA/YrhL
MIQRFEVLDGWRGISILLVLAAHLFPMGPKSWALNEAIAQSGMAIFFILSGFLITTILMGDPNLRRFLIHRVMRIVPLAWLVVLITFAINRPAPATWLGHLLFFANLQDPDLTPATEHFWSLCVEMQFYFEIALLFALFRDKAFWIVPLVGLAISIQRWYSGLSAGQFNFYRVDEILAGCTLALIRSKGGERLQAWIGALDPGLLFVALVAVSHRSLAQLDHLRPYVALLLVGSTLFAEAPRWYRPILRHRTLAFLAGISYALYVFHGGLRETWLGSGDTLERYLKRPLLLAATFGLAYLSTRHYERHWIRLGRRWGEDRARLRAPQHAT